MYYFTYMLRCEDNSIYTGYTDDLNKRMKSHFSEDKVHAKYTKSHRPVKVEAAWRTKEKKDACKLEYYIKTLNKKQKEDIILNHKLNKYLKEKIDSRKYFFLNLNKIINKDYL